MRPELLVLADAVLLAANWPGRSPMYEAADISLRATFGGTHGDVRSVAWIAELGNRRSEFCTSPEAAMTQLEGRFL